MNDISIQQFVDDLASSKPIGGGATCALVSALGCALGQMVGSLTVNKKKYAQYKEELTKLIDETNQLTTILLQGIEEDQKAFYPLSQAYKLDKDDKNREEIMQNALKQAAMSPYNLLINTTKVIDLLEKYARLGSIIAISDAATGAMLAHGALYGELINITVNTVKIKDIKFKEKIEQHSYDLLNTYSQKALKIYKDVNERINHG